MKLAMIVNAHKDPVLIKDTIESVKRYATDNVLLMLDGGVYDQLCSDDYGCKVVKGFVHQWPNSPYRNIMLALKTLRKTYPECDWYGYMEQDCLIASPKFTQDLYNLPDTVWGAGFDSQPIITSIVGRQAFDSYRGLPCLERLWGGKLTYWWVIGCCYFWKKDVFLELEKSRFIEKLLEYTKDFGSMFPGFNSSWSVDEMLVPTIVRSMGKDFHGFSSCSVRFKGPARPPRYDTYFEYEDKISGEMSLYTVRFRPEIVLGELDLDQVTIIHPTKTMGYLRTRLKEIRQGLATNRLGIDLELLKDLQTHKLEFGRLWKDRLEPYSYLELGLDENKIRVVSPIKIGQPHPNESFWKIYKNRIIFYNDKKDPTSCFSDMGQNGLVFGQYMNSQDTVHYLRVAN